MNPRFASLLKSLKLPALSQADLAAIQPLQRDWQRHHDRIAELQDHRITPDQKAAYEAFLHDPSAENEQRLAVRADTNLTARRHRVLRQAHTELRLRANQKAEAIIRPVAGRIHTAMLEDLKRREAEATAAELRASHDPRCQEIEWALNHFGSGMMPLLRGTSPDDGEVPPEEMAAFLTPGKEAAKPAA